jgi:hypothetical protein
MPCLLIFAQNDRFQHKKCIKIQNFIKRSKFDINHLQDLNNISKPAMFNNSRTNLAQNRILKEKKSCQICPKNTENSRFFEFQKSTKWQELAEPKSADKNIKSFGLARNSYSIFAMFFEVDEIFYIILFGFWRKKFLHTTQYANFYKKCFFFLFFVRSVLLFENNSVVNKIYVPKKKKKKENLTEMEKLDALLADDVDYEVIQIIDRIFQL